MIIRNLLADDRAEWLRMRTALWPDCSPERHLLEMEQLTVAGRGIVFVVERENGALCGFVEVAIRQDHVDGASSVPVAYLEAWYVDPEMRGQRVSRQLLEAAEKWTLARGVKELASDAELENEKSIEAHLSCGFRETCRAVHFIKAIGKKRNTTCI